MKQRGVWWVSVSNRVPSRILYVKWQHSEINGFINIHWFIVPFILQQRFGERSVDHVWNCWIWKRKIRGLPMCIFEIIQERCSVIWSFIEKILTHVYLELISSFCFTMSAISLRSIVYTRIAFSNKRRSIPRKEDNLQSLAYCIKKSKLYKYTIGISDFSHMLYK